MEKKETNTLTGVKLKSKQNQVTLHINIWIRRLIQKPKLFALMQF